MLSELRYLVVCSVGASLRACQRECGSSRRRGELRLVKLNEVIEKASALAVDDTPSSNPNNNPGRKL